MNNFKQFIENRQSLSIYSNDELEKERNKRAKQLNPFPLHVFHKGIKPFLQKLNAEYDLPESFIGLGLLTAYSTAIGNGYWLRNKTLGDIPCTIWGSLVGISSSGKSVLQHHLLKPIIEIQKEFDENWERNKANCTQEEFNKIPLKKVIFNDIHINTLSKLVMPSNPKGVLREVEEMIEWVNSFNTSSRGKDGTDEQFYLKAWNGKTHQLTRADRTEITIPKLFVNVFGGIQPTIIHKLFANDRDTTGFIYRILFAQPEIDQIAFPDIMYEMPQELIQIHSNAIKSMYYGLPVEDLSKDIKYCHLTNVSIKGYMAWKRELTNRINRIPDLSERNLEAGVFGKISEYVLRLCVLLHISDKAYNGQPYLEEEQIDIDVMERAIQLGDYFLKSAVYTTKSVKSKTSPSVEALRYKAHLSRGLSNTRIAELEFPDLKPETGRKRVAKVLKQLIDKFPDAFQTYNK